MQSCFVFLLGSKGSNRPIYTRDEIISAFHTSRVLCVNKFEILDINSLLLYLFPFSPLPPFRPLPTVLPSYNELMTQMLKSLFREVCLIDSEWGTCHCWVGRCHAEDSRAAHDWWARQDIRVHDTTCGAASWGWGNDCAVYDIRCSVCIMFG